MEVGYFNVHSAQFGDAATVEVICLFRLLSVILEDVSRSRNSWRLLGGSVKRRGRDMFAGRWFEVRSDDARSDGCKAFKSCVRDT